MYIWQNDTHPVRCQHCLNPGARHPKFFLLETPLRRKGQEHRREMALFRGKEIKVSAKRIKRVSVPAAEVTGQQVEWKPPAKTSSGVTSDRFKSRCLPSRWPLTPAIACPGALGHTSFPRPGYETSKASCWTGSTAGKGWLTGWMKSLISKTRIKKGNGRPSRARRVLWKRYDLNKERS